MNLLLDHPVLTIEEETSLFHLMTTGDDLAREELILCNQKLVASIAHEFTNRGIPLEELIQEGNVALIEGIDKHDPKKGKLSTYVQPKVRRALINFTYTYFRPVKLGDDLISYSSRLNQCIEELTEELQRPPTETEIVESDLFKHLKKQSRMKTETLLLLRFTHTPAVSLQQRIDTEDPKERATLSDFIADDRSDKGFIELERKDLIDHLFDGLDNREKQVYYMRYALDHKYTEIAKHFNLSSTRIKKIYLSAENKIKAKVEKDPELSRVAQSLI